MSCEDEKGEFQGATRGQDGDRCSFTLVLPVATGERTASFSGDIQDLPGRGPMQPAVGDPASVGELGWMIPRGPFQRLPFCDSLPRVYFFSFLAVSFSSNNCLTPTFKRT